MPIHDWTRVSDGTFHDFHTVWCGAIRTALNDGLLPSQYYAQAEQVARPLVADVLTLHANPDTNDHPYTNDGGVATAIAAPRVRFVEEGIMDEYVLKRRTVAIRHASGDRIVAIIEIVSPGNKAARYPFEQFVDKAVESLNRGHHLLIIDLFPPTPRDPDGIHSAIWHEFNATAVTSPPELPLTLAAYSAGYTKRAYVEPTAVGLELVEMPLFLTEDRYVNVPLEETYRAAYRGMPQRWKAVLEGSATLTRGESS